MSSHGEADDDGFKLFAAPFGDPLAVPALAKHFASVTAASLARGDTALGDAWRESRIIADRAIRLRCNLEALELVLRVRYGSMNALSKRFQIAAALMETYSPATARAFKPTGSKVGRLMRLAVQCARMPILYGIGAWTLRRLQRTASKP